MKRLRRKKSSVDISAPQNLAPTASVSDVVPPLYARFASVQRGQDASKPIVSGPMSLTAKLPHVRENDVQHSRLRRVSSTSTEQRVGPPARSSSLASTATPGSYPLPPFASPPRSAHSLEVQRAAPESSLLLEQNPSTQNYADRSHSSTSQMPALSRASASGQINSRNNIVPTSFRIPDPSMTPAPQHSHNLNIAKRPLLNSSRKSSVQNLTSASGSSAIESNVSQVSPARSSHSLVKKPAGLSSLPLNTQQNPVPSVSTPPTPTPSHYTSLSPSIPRRSLALISPPRHSHDESMANVAPRSAPEYEVIISHSASPSTQIFSADTSFSTNSSSLPKQQYDAYQQPSLISSPSTPQSNYSLLAALGPLPANTLSSVVTSDGIIQTNKAMLPTDLPSIPATGVTPTLLQSSQRLPHSLHPDQARLGLQQRLAASRVASVPVTGERRSPEIDASMTSSEFLPHEINIYGYRTESPDAPQHDLYANASRPRVAQPNEKSTRGLVAHLKLHQPSVPSVPSNASPPSSSPATVPQYDYSSRPLPQRPPDIIGSTQPRQPISNYASSLVYPVSTSYTSTQDSLPSNPLSPSIASPAYSASRRRKETPSYHNGPVRGRPLIFAAMAAAGPSEALVEHLQSAFTTEDGDMSSYGNSSEPHGSSSIVHGYPSPTSPPFMSNLRTSEDVPQMDSVQTSWNTDILKDEYREPPQPLLSQPSVRSLLPTHVDDSSRGPESPIRHPTPISPVSTEPVRHDSQLKPRKLSKARKLSVNDPALHDSHKRAGRSNGINSTNGRPHEDTPSLSMLATTLPMQIDTRTPQEVAVTSFGADVPDTLGSPIHLRSPRMLVDEPLPRPRVTSLDATNRSKRRSRDGVKTLTERQVDRLSVRGANGTNGQAQAIRQPETSRELPHVVESQLPTHPLTPTSPDEYARARARRRGERLEKARPEDVADVAVVLGQRPVSVAPATTEPVEEVIPTFYPLEKHVSLDALLTPLLAYLSFYDWCMLSGVSKQLREILWNEDLREVVLERYLKTVGYARWSWPEPEPLVITLPDLVAYMRGVSMPSHQYGQAAERFLQSHNDTPHAMADLAVSCRAYTRVVLRLRAQAEIEAAYSSRTSPTQHTSPQRGARSIYKTAGNRSFSQSQASVSRNSSRAPSPTSSFTHSQGHGYTSTSGQRIVTKGSGFHSPLFRLRRAPLLQVFVPSPEGDWLSDNSVLECEMELKRAGVIPLMRAGDVVWDAAVGDEGNVGRMIWDGSYLIDLDYTYSRSGDVPRYLPTLAFPPSYFHRVIRTMGFGNPTCHIDISPWGEEIAANLQLLQDRMKTETPQGGHHTVVRWVHRSSFTIRPQSGAKFIRIPVPSTAGPGPHPSGAWIIDRGWYGTVVVEAEGTNEGLADLQFRCREAFPPRAVGANFKSDRTARDEKRTVFRILRERSRPGEIWIRTVRDKERLLPPS